MKSLLKAVDAVAVVVALLGFILLIVTFFGWGVSGVADQFGLMLASADVILLIIIGLSVAWCVVRWKELNKRP